MVCLGGWVVMVKLPLLVAVDFSGASRRALWEGERLAKYLGAPVILVHAASHVPGLQSASISLGANVGPVQEAQAGVVVEEEQVLEKRWVAPLRRAGLQVECVVREGVPAEVILDVARERRVQYVVMGSHGRRGFRRVVLGSVVQDVLPDAPCPVLIVPSRRK